MYADKFKSITTYAREASDPKTFPNTPVKSEPYYELMKVYVSSNLSESANTQNIEAWQQRQIRQLHLRRSLGQYPYHTLSNIEKLNGDRLVSRMFQREPRGREVLIVVDQL